MWYTKLENLEGVKLEDEVWIKAKIIGITRIHPLEKKESSITILYEDWYLKRGVK